MHVYEDIRDELKKNKYVIYVVENNKFDLAFKFNGKKSELKEKITKKYLKKSKPDMFFVCFKFSFHTGTKQFQGGPLAVNLATFMFVNDELVNGAIHSKICARFMWKVWFSRIFLEKGGWKDLYFEKIIKKLLSNKVTLYPLIANSYVEFIDMYDK